MCDTAILENGGTLESVPECYKNKKKLLIITLMHTLMCGKVFSIHPSTIQFVPECGKI